jgi:hypothetical protein
MKRNAIVRVLAIGIAAGLAGGVAEVGWISAYAFATGIDAGSVAGGVTDTVGMAALPPVAGGIAIHMTIAAILGMALTAALAPLRLESAGRYGVLAGALAAVWAINFMIVLPLINPAFVEIVPLSVSFVSKLLFGMAAAASLQFSQRAEPMRVRAYRPRGVIVQPL